MKLAHMQRLVGKDATQLVVGETPHAHHYLVEEGIGRRVIVQQD